MAHPWSCEAQQSPQPQQPHWRSHVERHPGCHLRSLSTGQVASPPWLQQESHHGPWKAEKKYCECLGQDVHALQSYSSLSDHKPCFQANKIVFLGFQLWVCMFIGAMLEGYCQGENFSVLSDLGKCMLHLVLCPSLFYPSFLPASSLFCCHRTLPTPMSASNPISVLKGVCVCKFICRWVGSYMGCYGWQKNVLHHTSWWCLMALLLGSVADPAEQQSFSFRLCPTIKNTKQWDFIANIWCPILQFSAGLLTSFFRQSKMAFSAGFFADFVAASYTSSSLGARSSSPSRNDSRRSVLTTLLNSARTWGDKKS